MIHILIILSLAIKYQNHPFVSSNVAGKTERDSSMGLKVIFDNIS